MACWLTAIAGHRMALLRIPVVCHTVSTVCRLELTIHWWKSTMAPACPSQFDPGSCTVIAQNNAVYLPAPLSVRDPCVDQREGQ